MKILVFDIGGTAIKYGVCTDGRLSDAAEVPTRAWLGGRQLLETIMRLIEEKIDDADGLPGGGFDAIGVSTTGQVDTSEGSILFGNENIPDYTGLPVRSELEARFHLPAAVENDVNCAAIGEAVYGSAKEIPDFLCLTYGTGIGGAIIENHRIYHGSNYSAAEFGMIVTHADAKIAGGGLMDGCYEHYASVTALVEEAKRYDCRLNDGRKIFGALSDPHVMAILDHWIDEVLCGLSSVIHAFNPSCVVLGGGIMNQPLIFEKIAERRGHFLRPGFEGVRICPARLGSNAGLFGIYHIASDISAHISRNAPTP